MAKSHSGCFFHFFQRNRGIIISRGDIEISNTAFESWDNELSEKKIRGHQNILRLHNRPWISLVGPKKPFFRGLKTPKMAYESKIRFFQSPRYEYPNPTTEKETSKQCYNHLEISHTSWKKGFLRKRENVFWHNFFIKDSEKVWSFDYKKIIIIARLVFQISQFFKNFSFFFGHRARLVLL